MPNYPSSDNLARTIVSGTVQTASASSGLPPRIQDALDLLDCTIEGLGGDLGALESRIARVTIGAATPSPTGQGNAISTQPSSPTLQRLDAAIDRLRTMRGYVQNLRDSVDL